MRYCVGEDSKTKHGSTIEMRGCVIIHRGVAELTGQRCKILSEAESVSQWSPPPQFAYSLAERGESGALGNRLSQSVLEGERDGLKEERDQTSFFKRMTVAFSDSHESSITVYGSWKSQASSPWAKQHRAEHVPSWRNHLQGWMTLNMLLS